uniref:Uncharacterized protein n=1 Tax=Romanomermis culicivorax TaxID=13658 RepID=A0A915KMD8_ROMCU
VQLCLCTISKNQCDSRNFTKRSVAGDQEINFDNLDKVEKSDHQRVIVNKPSIIGNISPMLPTRHLTRMNPLGPADSEKLTQEDKSTKKKLTTRRERIYGFIRDGGH